MIKILQKIKWYWAGFMPPFYNYVKGGHEASSIPLNFLQYFNHLSYFYQNFCANLIFILWRKIVYKFIGFSATYECQSMNAILWTSLYDRQIIELWVPVYERSCSVMLMRYIWRQNRRKCMKIAENIFKLVYSNAAYERQSMNACQWSCYERQ